MSSGNVSITNIVIAKVNMLHGDSLETRPPCFSLHATFNYVNERIVTSTCWNNSAARISRISKVSLSLPKHQVFVEHVCEICRPLLLYLRRKFRGNVFAIMSVHHKNEIKNSGQYVGRKVFFSGLWNVFVLGFELRVVSGILVSIFLHTWCIQKFVNHSGRAEIWPAFTTYFGRRDERRRFHI